MEYGGAINQSSSSRRNQGDPSWGGRDRHHQAQVDYAQGKGLTVIGYLVDRSHALLGDRVIG